MCLWNGEPLVDALAAIGDMSVPLVSIMHTEGEFIDACLDIVQDKWSGPIGVYAHTGRFVDDKWKFDDAISPSEYAAHAERWLESGVQIIGGCCDIGVDHITALKRLI